MANSLELKFRHQSIHELLINGKDGHLRDWGGGGGLPPPTPVAQLVSILLPGWPNKIHPSKPKARFGHVTMFIPLEKYLIKSQNTNYGHMFNTYNMELPHLTTFNLTLVTTRWPSSTLSPR